MTATVILTYDGRQFFMDQTDENLRTLTQLDATLRDGGGMVRLTHDAGETGIAVGPGIPLTVEYRTAEDNEGSGIL